MPEFEEHYQQALEVSAMYREMHERCLGILDEWKKRGQINYGDAFLELGARGQFSDIWRKIKKLQRSVWLGQGLIGEQAVEIAEEIIPHLLMMIYCLEHQLWEERPEAVEMSPYAPIELIEFDAGLPERDRTIIRSALQSGAIRVRIR